MNWYTLRLTLTGCLVKSIGSILALLALAGPCLASPVPEEGLLKLLDGLPKAPVIATQLVPAPSGPGVGICEPVGKTASAATLDFGAGCARWLLFSLGEHPELGQTPRWETLGGVRKELGTPDFRLTLTQVTRFASATGYTHVAVGEITGQPQSCTLTYQLYAMPAKTPVGPLLKATGSEAQVMKALPGLERQLLQSLQENASHVANVEGVTPDDLRSIGHYAWYSTEAVPIEEQKRIDALAVRQPLAGLLSLIHRTPGYSKAQEADIRQLVALAPKNLLIYSGILKFWSYLSQPLRDDLMRSLPDIKGNYITANFRIFTSTNRQEATIAAEQSARFAPRNPTNWSQLANMYLDIAQNIRRGRFPSMITEQEWSVLKKLYSRAVEVGKRAVELDPEYGIGWYELARSATFAGEDSLADRAFWNAIKFEKGNGNVYEWGLQMYQAKWLGDHDKLAKVARLALEDNALPPHVAFSVSSYLREADFPDEAAKMYNRGAQNYRDYAAKHPGTAETHRETGYLLYGQGKFDEALAEYKAARELSPENLELYFSVGLIYMKTSRFNEAAAEFQAELKLAPDAYVARTELSIVLNNLNRVDESVAEYRKVIAEHPNYFRAVDGLAHILWLQGKLDESIKLYEQAAYLEPMVWEPYQFLSDLYYRTGKIDMAIEAGKMSLTFYEDNYWVHLFLGTAYSAKKLYNESIEELKRANTLSPKRTGARLQLVRVYVELVMTEGDKNGNKMRNTEAARSLVQEITDLASNSDDARQARELLAKIQ